jgi:Phosphotyrosyl phosphate activator (PTPA) protein
VRQRGLYQSEAFLSRSRCCFRPITHFAHLARTMTTDFTSFPKVEGGAAFNQPVKLINSDADVARFNASVAFDRIVGFLLLVNEAVKGRNLDEDIQTSPAIQAIGKVLDILNTWIDEVPPSTGPRRFGNVAFREWMQRLEEVFTPR